MDDLIEHLARLANQARADFSEEWNDAAETGERPDLEPIIIEVRVEFAESLIDEITDLRARLEAVEQERDGALGWRTVAESNQAMAQSWQERAERAEAALATARRLANDAIKMCEDGYPVSAYNLATQVIRALANEATE